MARGRLPNFAQLAARGGFAPLGTSIPPQSPVAWSSFITGLDPGGHGIFDFIHRDPKTMAPFLSTTRTEPPSRFVSLGKWQLPLTAGRVELLRQGPGFLGRARGARHRDDDRPHARELPAVGHGDARVERDGHAGPARHLRHVLVLHVRPVRLRGGPVAGGTIDPVDVARRRRARRARGPGQPAARSSPRRSRPSSPRTSTRSRTFAKIVVGDEERLLRVGEWSDWVPVQFELRRAETLARAVPLLPEAARAGVRAVRQPAEPRPAGAGDADLVPRPGTPPICARHRALLHAGHAGGHQGPEDRRADDRRVPGAGADRRATKSSGSTATCSNGSPTGSCSTTSATSTRCRT